MADPINYADTAWVMVATAFVLMMIFNLGYFEAGLIRTKNAINPIMQMWTGVCILSCTWYIIGFSLVFGTSHIVIGSVEYTCFFNVPDRTPFKGQTIPGTLFGIYQMMFFTITPLLISGAWVERLKWRPFVIFIVVWNLLVYCPVAHWVWGGGFMSQWGVLDFAGGIVIHTTCGVGSAIMALALGRRSHFTKDCNALEVNEAHNIPMAIQGASFLWMGWFGFNGGSALAINSIAVQAVLNTHMAGAAAGMVWLFLTHAFENRASSVGIITGVIAGLAGVTPASGFISSQSATVIGLICGLASYGAIYVLKTKLLLDDALDVSSVHGITGIIGSLATGVSANPKINPAGEASWNLFGMP